MLKIPSFSQHQKHPNPIMAKSMAVTCFIFEIPSSSLPYVKGLVGLASSAALDHQLSFSYHSSRLLYREHIGSAAVQVWCQPLINELPVKCWWHSWHDPGLSKDIHHLCFTASLYKESIHHVTYTFWICNLYVSFCADASCNMRTYLNHMYRILCIYSWGQNVTYIFSHWGQQKV